MGRKVRPVPLCFTILCLCLFPRKNKGSPLPFPAPSELTLSLLLLLSVSSSFTQGKKGGPKSARPQPAEGAGVPGSGVPSGIHKGQTGYEDVVMECEGFERYYKVRPPVSLSFPTFLALVHTRSGRCPRLGVRRVGRRRCYRAYDGEERCRKGTSPREGRELGVEPGERAPKVA